jgi:staphylococcal nuclease domain-containing protein 1
MRVVLPDANAQDVLVSDIRADPFSFSFQTLKDGGIPELERLMKDFALHHKTLSQPASVTPRSGDMVSARFSVDQQWYRARVLRANPAKKQAEVQFVDYGNSEQLPFSELRTLDGSFKSLPSQSQSATLSLVSLFDSKSDYGAESLDLFRSLAEVR